MRPGEGAGRPGPRRRDKLRRREPEAAPTAPTAPRTGTDAPAEEGGFEPVWSGAAPPDPDDPRLSWLEDDPSAEGWKPEVFRAELKVRPPTRALVTAPEAALLAAAFVTGTLLALLALGWITAQLGAIDAGAPRLLVEQKVPLALAGGSSASLIAWRATGRRRRAWAKHLGVGKADGKGEGRGHTRR